MTTSANPRAIPSKLPIAVDSSTHAIVSAEVSVASVASVSDNEVFPTLVNPLRRRVEQISADGAYDTRACYREVLAGVKVLNKLTSLGMPERRGSFY